MLYEVITNELLEALEAATGIDGADIRADAAAGNVIDGDFFFFQCFNNSYMGPTARRPTAEHQANGLSR